MLPMYNTKTFNDIYDNAADFITDYTAYEASIGDVNKVTNNYVAITWTLLTGRYGNSPIANKSEEQFKIKLFNIMFMYAPTWAKRLEVQTALRELSIGELTTGSKLITNTASNPQTEPDTQALMDVTFIDNQTTQNQQKSKISGYGSLLELLKTDVCAYYIDRFGELFKHVLVPDVTEIYITEEQ